MTLQRTTLSEKILSQKVFKCVLPLYSILDSSGEQIRDCQELRRGSEKAVEPHSSTLAWKIPWTEEPGGLRSMGSLRVRHD